MIDRDRITGLVLAGGRGSRMGHRDKGLAIFHDRPLVAHALARLAPQVGRTMVSANRHLDAYARFGVPVVTDEDAGFAGPLAGIAAGLARCETDYLAAVPCDAPFFPSTLVAALGLALEACDAPVAHAMTAQRSQPVFCLVRRDARNTIVAALEADRRSVTAWIASVGGIAVAFDDEDAFRNLNTLDDLDRSTRSGSHVEAPDRPR